MDRARDELLADAAFSEQQHGRVGRRRALDRVPDVAKAGTLPDHLVTHFRRALQRAVLVDQARAIQLVLDGDQQPLRPERLLDEIDCAALRGLERGARGPMRRNHHDRHRLVDRLDPAQRFHAVHARHLDVEEDDVRRLALHERDALFGGRRRKVLVAFVLEGHPHGIADAGVVVYEENAGGHLFSVVSRQRQSTVTVIKPRRVLVGS